MYLRFIIGWLVWDTSTTRVSFGQEIRNFFRFFFRLSTCPSVVHLWFGSKTTGLGPGRPSSPTRRQKDFEKCSNSRRQRLFPDLPGAGGFIRSGRWAAYRPSLPANDRRVVIGRETGPGIGGPGTFTRNIGGERAKKNTASDGEPTGLPSLHARTTGR